MPTVLARPGAAFSPVAHDGAAPAPCVIVADLDGPWRAPSGTGQWISAVDFIAGRHPALAPGTTIINLCRDMEVRSLGHACSMMAQARGHRVIPSVETIVALAGAATHPLPQLAELVARDLSERDGLMLPVQFCFDVYFGATDFTPLAELARALFTAFPVPLVRFECALDEGWTIRAVALHDVATVRQRQQRLCYAALAAFMRAPVVCAISPRYRIQW
jgi:hypothetical protein